MAAFFEFKPLLASCTQKTNEKIIARVKNEAIPTINVYFVCTHRFPVIFLQLLHLLLCLSLQSVLRKPFLRILFFNEVFFIIGLICKEYEYSEYTQPRGTRSL